MTFRPVNPYDALVQQLLENVTRTTEATERGLMAQREERLIGEERAVEQKRIDQQRAWQVADQDRAQEERLTELANNMTSSLVSTLGPLTAFADDEQRAEVMALFRALQQPTNLTGQAALDHARSGIYVADVNGAPTELNAWEYVGLLKRNYERSVAEDSTLQKFIDLAIDDVTNTDLEMTFRVERANSIKDNPLVSPAVRDAFIDAVVADPEARERVKRGDEIQAQDLRLKEQAVALGDLEVQMQELYAERYPEFLQLQYDDGMAALAGKRQQISLTNLEMFKDIGYIPDDEEEALKLARNLGFVNEDGTGSLSQLRSVGQRHYIRWQQRQNILLEAERNQNVLFGTQIDMNKLALERGRYELERDITWDDLNNRVAMGQAAAEAMMSGNVELLESWQALSELPQFEEALGNISWGSVISYARQVRGDEEDLREHNADLRDLELSRLRRQEHADIDTFVATTAGTFLLEDFSPDANGDQPALEAAVREYVDSIDNNTLRAYGMSADDLVSMLMRRANTLNVAQGRTEAQAVVDALLTSGPPSDPTQRRAWEAAITDAYLRTGLWEPEEVHALLSGELEQADLARAKTLADLRNVQQQADEAFSRTLVNYASLAPEEAETEAEAIIAWRNEQMEQAKAEMDLLAQAMDSQACGVTTDESNFGQRGASYNYEDETCKRYAVDYDAAMTRWQMLQRGVIVNPDGTVDFDLNAAGQAESGEVAIFNPPSPEELRAIINSRPDVVSGQAAEFDMKSWTALPTEMRDIIAQGVSEGAPISELNANMTMLLVTLSGAPNAFVSAPEGLATFSQMEAGLEEEGETFRSLPPDTRQAVLESTQDWMDLVADLANKQIVPNEDDYAKWAEQYGFMKLIGPPRAGWQDAIARTLKPDFEAPTQPDVEGLKAAIQTTQDKLIAQRDARLQNDVMRGQFTVPGAAAPTGPQQRPAAPPVEEEPAPPALQGQADYVAQLASMFGIGPATPFGSGIPGQSQPQPAPPGEPAPATNMALGPDGLQTLRNHEGFSATAYPDGQYYSIGYGHNGPDVKPGMVITEEQALRFLEQDVGWASEAVRTALDPGTMLTQPQFDALVSFVYNVGVGAWQESGIPQLISKGDLEGAAARMMLYVNAGERKGVLRNRRQAEVAMLLGNG